MVFIGVMLFGFVYITIAVYIFDDYHQHFIGFCFEAIQTVSKQLTVILYSNHLYGAC